MKMKKRESGGGANWMDTYGDMVTLLLCFFVLLYSMSTISEEKWRAIVQSFNPDSIKEQTATPEGGSGPNADSDVGEGGPIIAPGLTEEEAEAAKADMQDMINNAIEELYEALKNYAEESNAGQDIEVTKGDGYVFVSFNDAVFFDGDSYVLRQDGREILSTVGGILSKAAGYIDEVRIMGHTAQASPNQANEPYVDRMLSAQRSGIATYFLQDHCSLAPGRIVSMAYGQHRPIASNDVEENRSKNRRVEMVVTGLDMYNELGDSIKQYHLLREGEAELMTETTSAPEESAPPTEGAASGESAAPEGTPVAAQSATP